MDENQFLKDLDKHAAEFNFPVLDNANLEFAAARLSAFWSPRDWLIAFEVLGFSSQEVQFIDDLYAFGSCVAREGLIGEEIPVTSTRDSPLFDEETSECIVDWRQWSVKLRGEEISFSPTKHEYSQAGITSIADPGPGSLMEIDLLRFLVYRVGEARLFMDDNDLLSYFPLCKNVSKFIQTVQWQHPDIANQEEPSRNVSIRSLVAALSQGDPSLFDRGRPNTHWGFWSTVS